jgi:hypothetical protein
MRDTGNKSVADRIGYDCKHDRDAARSLRQRRRPRRAETEQGVGLESHELSCIGLHLLPVAVREAVVDLEIAAFDPTQAAQLLHEGR